MSEVLKEAMNRIADRVAALDVDSSPCGYVPEEYTRMIVSDLDMDTAEVRDQMHHLAGMVLAQAVGNPSQGVCCLIADALVQAVATGIMHERVRVEHEGRQG